MRDVRMVQGGERARLALESREPVGVAREQSGRIFDCDVTAELGVVGAIHLAHAAAPIRLTIS